LDYTQNSEQLGKPGYNDIKEVWTMFLSYLGYRYITIGLYIGASAIEARPLGSEIPANAEKEMRNGG
jgi:hypothetical protein